MIDCKTLAANKKAALTKYVEENNLHDVTLAIVQVGDDPASCAYVRGKIKDCEEVGIKSEHIKLSGADESTVNDILATIDELNRKENVRGIILQLPLPDPLKPYTEALLSAIRPSLDIDGLSNGFFLPPTARAVAEILKSIDFNPQGKVCAVIGRGKTAGWPIANMLEDAGATVIWCNSKTSARDMEQLINMAELIVSCTGVSGLLGEQIDCGVLGKYGCVGIDVGISRGEDGKLYGDISKDLYSNDAMLTPVPGGVGLMTRVALLENLLGYEGE